MLKLLRGEIYRLHRKKSLYIYFGALAVVYLAIAFIRSGGFTQGSIANDALSYFVLLPALVGGFLFTAIYTDDLGSKNLIALVGSGTQKATIVIAKFLLMLAFCTVFFAVVPLYHVALYALFGQQATTSILVTLYAAALKYLLVTLAFAALSGIVVYGLQRVTFALVTYLLLAFGVVNGLFSMALKAFAPSLAEHLVTGVSDRIMLALVGGGPVLLPILELCAYIVAALVASLVVFSRKEMEF